MMKVNENKDSNTPPTAPKSTRPRYIPAIALSGVATALVFAATTVSVPNGAGGNINLGDGIILLCAYIMGPWVAFPAAIGSALSDLALGYTAYMPATLVIKGLLGLAAGLILRKSEPRVLRKSIAFITAEVIMVGGYFFYEWLLSGFSVGVAGLPGNLIQAAAAIVIAFVLTAALHPFRAKARDLLNP
jgi:uncharacterized membrane protein